MMRSAWILLALACNGSSDDTGSNGDTGPIEPATFTEVRDEILLNSCAFSSCHGDQGSAGLTLTTESSYDALVNVPSTKSDGEILVIPGDADGSYLIHKMEGADGIVGDIMPPGAGLPEEKIQAVRSWIDNGAPND